MLRLIGAVSSCISRSFSISSLSVSVYFRSITTYLPDLQLFGDRPLLRLASNLLQGHPAHNREGVRQILDYKPTVRVQSMSLHDLLLFQCRDFSILHQYSTSVLSMILSITLRIPSSSAASSSSSAFFSETISSLASSFALCIARSSISSPVNLYFIASPPSYIYQIRSS